MQRFPYQPDVIPYCFLDCRETAQKEFLANLAVVYAWTNESDLAFEQLVVLTKTPHGVYYGQLKADPLWTPIRKDPRFEKLLAELVPKE
jgi:hypothetical protein